MAIELNVSQIAARTTAAAAQDAATTQTGKSSSLASLLGGDSLIVSSGAMTDLEALVARLKNDQDRTRFSLLLSSLNSLNQSLTAAQKAAVAEGVKLEGQLKDLQDSIKDLEKSLSSDQGDLAIMQAKIESLQKQIEQAVKDGKDHNELVAKQKELRKEIDAKEQVIADTKGKIAAAKNEVSAVQGKISAIVKSIGGNTLMTIANELTKLSEPEKAERPAESAKEAEKEAENNLFAAIRESLEKIGRDIEETILENRTEMA